MRRRRPKRLCQRLTELQRQQPSRDEALLKLGAARKEAGPACYLLSIRLPKAHEAVTAQTFTFTINRRSSRSETQMKRPRHQSRCGNRGIATVAIIDEGVPRTKRG